MDDIRTADDADFLYPLVGVEDLGVDATTGMEWVSLIIQNSYYATNLRRRLRRRCDAIRLELMSAEIIVGGNRDAPK